MSYSLSILQMDRRMLQATETGPSARTHSGLCAGMTFSATDLSGRRRKVRCKDNAHGRTGWRISRACSSTRNCPSRARRRARRDDVAGHRGVRFRGAQPAGASGPRERAATRHLQPRAVAGLERGRVVRHACRARPGVPLRDRGCAGGPRRPAQPQRRRSVVVATLRRGISERKTPPRDTPVRLRRPPGLAGGARSPTGAAIARTELEPECRTRRSTR